MDVRLPNRKVAQCKIHVADWRLQSQVGSTSFCASCLWCHQHDIDVFPEVGCIALQDAKKEAVRQAERRAGLHCSQDARIELGLHAVIATQRRLYR